MATVEHNIEKGAARHVLPKHMGGGPHGLGDPDDKTLRKVEREIIIPKKMKEGAQKKCADKVKVFTECGKAQGLMMPFRCRKENQVMQECIVEWFNDPNYFEEKKIEYLKERTEYRTTGITAKQKRKEAATF